MPLLLFRYTVVKNGRRRLFVPNQAFLTREFMVMDDADSPKSSSKRDLFPPELTGHLEQQEAPQQTYAPDMQHWSQPQSAPPQPQYNWYVLPQTAIPATGCRVCRIRPRMLPQPHSGLRQPASMFIQHFDCRHDCRKRSTVTIAI